MPLMTGGTKPSSGAWLTTEPTLTTTSASYAAPVIDARATC